MNRETPEFRFSRVSKVMTYANLTFETIVACGFVALATYAIDVVRGPVLLLGELVMYFVGAMLICRVLMRLRYRYVMNEYYLVAGDGISMQIDGEQKIVEWKNITKAEYLPIFTTYRLFVNEHKRPIVLFAQGEWWPNAPENRRNKDAGMFIRSGLGSRLRNRWLPW
jgi:hypothetical protein